MWYTGQWVAARSHNPNTGNTLVPVSSVACIHTKQGKSIQKVPFHEGENKKKRKQATKACKSCDDLVKRTHVLLLNAWAGNEGPF
jgi:hypothetical protein